MIAYSDLEFFADILSLFYHAHLSPERGQKYKTTKFVISQQAQVINS